MKLYEMTHSEIDIAPYDDRLWVFMRPCEISMLTDEGKMTMHIAKGFVTDFRSPGGSIGSIVDLCVSNTGPGDQGICYIFHDASYTQCASLGGQHPISRELADDLLRQSLILKGMPTWKAWLVYNAVALFGEGPYDESPEWDNTFKVNFNWSPK